MTMEQSKTAENIGDPKEFLRQFAAMLKGLELPGNLIENNKEVINRTKAMLAAPGPPVTRARNMEDVFPGYAAATDSAYSVYHLVTKFLSTKMNLGHQLFLSILQVYTLPPALRKKVESANRFYLKKSNPRLKEHGDARYLEMFALYEKLMLTLKGHLEIAKQAVEKGKAHAEEGSGATKIKVGDFTLVNTGGFPEKIMNEVSDVAQKVQSLLKSSGLGQVCYGDIQVTNTIHKANVAAFYLIAHDELFIRANIKGSNDTVKTVLHELGHRFELKFLNGKQREIERLYQLIGGQERSRKWDHNKDRKPQPGTRLKTKGKTFIVKTVLPDVRHGFKVFLDVEGKPGATASVPLDSYLELQGEEARDTEADPNYKGFVSEYAKKGGPSENFAEMFAFFAMGRLPVLQSVEFEELVFGQAKTAHNRTTLRVASRWILEG
jgi:hypothetical protein